MYRLRELERKDLNAINGWQNDSELISLLGAPFPFIGPEIDVRWFENYLNNRGNAVRCAITEFDNDAILGLVSLTDVDYINQCAQFHIMIVDKPNQGRGIEAFAVQQMLYHAFNNMNLKRIELVVLDDNEHAKHLYEKYGFVREGCKRRARFKNGRFADLILYSILRNEISSNISGKNWNLPDFCIEEFNQIDLLEYVIKTCDNAFEVPIRNRDYCRSIIEKLSVYAHFVVAYSDQIHGYAALYVNDLKTSIAYLSLIGVRPEFQRRHIGQRLLKYCESLSCSHGMDKLRLEVRKDNEKAKSFYEANGYIYLPCENEHLYMEKIL